LKASRGSLQFEAPQFASLDDFATIYISTVVGGTSKVFKFNFEYLPKITGPAVVTTVSPTTIMEDEDLTVLVTIANVHRIDFPYSAMQLLVHVADAEIATKHVSIISSDRMSTSLSISVPASNLTAGGLVTIGVGSRSGGSAQLGAFTVAIV